MVVGGLRLIDHLIARVTGVDPGSHEMRIRPGGFTDRIQPPSEAHQRPSEAHQKPSTSSMQRAAFTSTDLGEITPFSNPTLPALDGT